MLDVKCLLDVERYRRVNVDASGAGISLSPERSCSLRNAIPDFSASASTVFTRSVCRQATGRIYARLVDGKPVWVDRRSAGGASADPDTRAGLLAVAPSIFDVGLPEPDRPAHLQEAIGGGGVQTLGRWGGEVAS